MSRTSRLAASPSMAGRSPVMFMACIDRSPGQAMAGRTGIHRAAAASGRPAQAPLSHQHPHRGHPQRHRAWLRRIGRIPLGEIHDVWEGKLIVRCLRAEALSLPLARQACPKRGLRWTAGKADRERSHRYAAEDALRSPGQAAGRRAGHRHCISRCACAPARSSAPESRACWRLCWASRRWLCRQRWPPRTGRWWRRTGPGASAQHRPLFPRPDRLCQDMVASSAAEETGVTEETGISWSAATCRGWRAGPLADLLLELLAGGVAGRLRPGRRQQPRGQEKEDAAARHWAGRLLAQRRAFARMVRKAASPNSAADSKSKFSGRQLGCRAVQLFS